VFTAHWSLLPAAGLGGRAWLQLAGEFKPGAFTCAHTRRRFQRGLKRKPLALIKKLRKAKREAASGEKPDPVRTHLRNMIIVPEMIGSVIGVYNGKTFNQVCLRFRRFGFIPAWQPAEAACLQRSEGKKGMCPDVSACEDAGGDQARHGRALPGRVFHQLQARQARQAWHWRHALVEVHPSEVSGGGAGVCSSGADW